MRYLIIILVLGLTPIHSFSKEFELITPTNELGLTPEIVERLLKEKCKIPKWVYKFGGVTLGEFAEKNQKDTAVICSKKGVTTIRIFWGGKKKCPDEIDSIGQYISTVDEKYIIQHYQAYGGIKPPKITHEAINDHYVEKSSIVKYCHNGRWVDLTGAD